MVERVLEISVFLIALYIVVINAEGFSTAVSSIGNVYSKSVKTLQGR